MNDPGSGFDLDYRFRQISRQVGPLVREPEPQWVFRTARRRHRTRAAASTLALAVLVGGGVVFGLNQQTNQVLPAPPAGPGRTASPLVPDPDRARKEAARSVVQRFVQRYIEAVEALESGGDRTMGQLRQEYLTAELNTQLDRYAEQAMADPVLHAQDLPTRFFCEPGTPNAGTVPVDVVTYYPSGQTLVLRYTVRSSDRKITGLVEVGAKGDPR